MNNEDIEAVLTVNEDEMRAWWNDMVMDPSMYMACNFGYQLNSYLQGAGRNYSMEVSNFGQFVVVKATYNSPEKVKSVSKTYVVMFNNPKKTVGRVYAGAKKWRSISNPSEAASYIISSIRSYGGF